MKNNRRDFLKLIGLTGISAAGVSVFPACSSGEGAGGIGKNNTSNLNNIHEQAMKKYTQQFNMSGYAAPKLDTVRIGFIGLGNRGPAAVRRMSKIEGVDIKALCDLQSEKVDTVIKDLESTSYEPKSYSGNKDEWKKLCELEDIDLVYIATPWHLHTPMAVYAMENNKHVCVEVPAATTVEECWQLVETSERTRRHCMMLENCCYDYFELLTLNMARQGFFGEIIHGEGAYIHDLLEGNFDRNKYWNHWRLKENANRNGNLYPTHGLGPICQIMNINRGDKMDYLVSVSSNDFMMRKMAKELASTDEFFRQYVDDNFRGNMNTTTIRTKKGCTIMLQHDVTSPRPYSRIHLVSGTKGAARKYPLSGRISLGHDWISEEEFKLIEEKYTPEIIIRIGEMAKQIGGHGGMDFIMDWRTIDCIRNGLPLDQDVYDAALWSSVGPLSEWSVANRSNSIDVPDFTAGAWKNNQPLDLELEEGGKTSIK